MRTNIHKTVKPVAFLAALYFILFSVHAVAQTDTIKKQRLHGGFGHLNFSFEQFNINPLNNLLATNGYNKLSSTGYSFGGGGMFLIHNFLLGGEGASLRDSETENATNRVTMSGSYGYFNAGYIVWSGKRSLLYPSIGLGHGSYNIEVRTKETGPGFPQQLNTPSGLTTLKADGTLINAQLGYMYFFNKGGKQGFFIGIKAGYKFAPGKWNVRVNGQTMNDAPNINLSGFYATITLGGGGISTH